MRLLFPGCLDHVSLRRDEERRSEWSADRFPGRGKEDGKKSMDMPLIEGFKSFQ